MPVPVSVVRLFVKDMEGRILLLKRSDTNYANGQWCLPGGKIDYGDTVEEAARRELAEETGLTVRNLQFAFYQDSLPMTAEGMHCLNMYFECEAEGDVVLNNESSAFQWIQPDEADRYKIAFRNDQAIERWRLGEPS